MKQAAQRAYKVRKMTRELKKKVHIFFKKIYSSFLIFWHAGKIIKSVPGKLMKEVRHRVSLLFINSIYPT